MSTTRTRDGESWDAETRNSARYNDHNHLCDGARTLSCRFRYSCASSFPRRIPTTWRRKGGQQPVSRCDSLAQGSNCPRHVSGGGGRGRGAGSARYRSVFRVAMLSTARPPTASRCSPVGNRTGRRHTRNGWPGPGWTGCGGGQRVLWRGKRRNVMFPGWAHALPPSMPRRPFVTRPPSRDGRVRLHRDRCPPALQFGLGARRFATPRLTRRGERRRRSDPHSPHTQRTD